VTLQSLMLFTYLLTAIYTTTVSTPWGSTGQQQWGPWACPMRSQYRWIKGCTINSVCVCVCE